MDDERGDPFDATTQITNYRGHRDEIVTAGGKMAWRSWLLLERARLQASGRYGRVWLQDRVDDCALFAEPADRACARGRGR